MSDVRSIVNVDNRFGCTYKVELYNQESANKIFPIIPDSASAKPGEDKPTEDMWTPWCDSQKDLDAGHYVKVTFSEKGKDDIVNYIIQSGPYVYCLDSSKRYDTKAIMGGDSNDGKGEYKLEIKANQGEPVIFIKKY